MASYTREYIQYLIHFHADRDYFECHEVLEAYWKEHPRSPLKSAWVGLIQTAVSMYHQRRKNITGALKMIQQAQSRLTVHDLNLLGIDADLFLSRLRMREKSIAANPDAPFTDLDIPLADPDLVQLCRDMSSQIGLEWEKPSDLLNDQLIHRHTLRDRQGLINAREAAMEQRKRILREDREGL